MHFTFKTSLQLCLNNNNNNNNNNLLQSALQPLWVLACSPIVEYSQQEGFTECRCQRHVKPQLGGPVIRTFQLLPQGVPSVWNDASESQQRKVELWTRKFPRILSKVGSFTCRKFMTWDRLLYFPSEGRRAEDFFRPKNPTASAGFEPANLGTKCQHAHL